MRYSYEYKRKAVELFRQGLWPETPDGTSTHHFHDTIRKWVKIEDSYDLSLHPTLDQVKRMLEKSI